MERPDDRSPDRGFSRAAVLCVAAAATVLTALSGLGSWPLEATNSRLGTVRPSAASDPGLPGFKHPTAITNPMFPVSQLTQVIELGSEGSDRMRFETTLLPETMTVAWKRRNVTTVVSQSVAYEDGRVAEVSRDFYAQADDGAVWSFGEDVAEYSDGALVSREGTWLAGRDGLPVLVMPAKPRAGDVFRSLNPPTKAEEESTIRSTGQSVDGPRGKVDGALLIEEHLVDGAQEDKTFAPGYGEIHALDLLEGESYDLAVAVPTDAVPGVVPENLVTLWSRAAGLVASRSPEWAQVDASLDAMKAAWARYAAGPRLRMLVPQMSERLDDLAAAVADRQPALVRQAAIDVAHASLDLQLRHRAPSAVDWDRLRLWASQLQADASADDAASVDGDVVVIDALWARIGEPTGPARAPFDAALADLRAAAGSKDLAQAATIAGLLAFV